MKRKTARNRLVPLDGLERPGHRPTGRVTERTDGKPVDRDWFSIKNLADDETEIFIYDEIGYWGTTADMFVRQLNDIDASKISLRINSPGGEVFDGVTIYNALKRHKAEVTVHVDGLAASAASFIAQAGDKIIMHDGSTMMIHDASAMSWGNEKDFLDMAKVLATLSDSIASIYASNAGEDKDFWRALMREEVWYNGDEAVAAGLADATSEDDSNKPKNGWDLSVFAHAGRDDAPSPTVVRESVMTNRLKENTVVPKNEADEKKTVETVSEPSAPIVTPEEPATVSVPDGDAPGTGLEGDQVPVPAPVVTPEEQASNRAPFAAIINGVSTTDPVKVQAYINKLEQTQRENVQTARASFLDKLASDGKIAAPQKEAIAKHTATLSDEQYATWEASWEAAPALALFGRHGGNTEGSSRALPASAADRDQKIADLQDIVQHHRNTGMSQADIEAKDSFKELQILLAERDA